MTTSNRHVMVLPEEFQAEDIQEFVLNCEKNSYQIEKPQDVKTAKQLLKEVHSILASRLIKARNRSGLNNDKINRAMVSAYMDRGREGKAWTFTNALSSRMKYFPDGEEVEMLSKIMGSNEAELSLHLTVIPWAYKDQLLRREERRKRPTSRRVTSSTSRPVRSQQAPVQKQEAKTVAQTKQEAVAMPNPVPSSIPVNAGDMKITHNGNTIHVHGKVWCDKKTAGRLRMIVPLKLLNQARNDDPWCYEMNGPVHDYQLYNLIHVLYNAPKVLTVQHD